MSQNSNIEWTDATWNPTRGCSRVSEGCRNCYAESIASRFNGTKIVNGKRELRPFAGFAIRTSHGPQWTGRVELIESKLLEPLHWRKPRRVFVNSMSDLFHESLPDHVIGRIFAVMQQTPHITYQILTKRARRMREWHETNPPYTNSSVEFLPNVWLGVSVENQPTADERIPELLRTPAAVRFVSYEPALAEVDLTPWLTGHEEHGVDLSRSAGSRVGCCVGWTPGLDWCIVGGESGPNARPFNLEWARSTIRQFKAAGVPLFVKQLGSNPVQTADGCLKTRYPTSDSKGGKMSEWPEDLRVREFPKARI